MPIPRRKFRRNTIVIHKDGGFYGRIIRVLPDDRYLWLCSGLHFKITKGANLEATDYRGYYGGKWDGMSKRFHPMTSLRNLKRHARQFHGDFAHNTPLDYEFISVQD